MFLCFHPPQTAESTQPADAGHCRPLRYSIDDLLDKWFLSEISIEKCEGKITTSDHRSLISNLVGGAMGATIDEDDLRAGCFERARSLTQLKKSNARSKIRLKLTARKIDAPLIRAHAEEGSEFSGPAEVTVLEEVISGSVDSDGAYDSSEVIYEGGTVADEEDAESTAT